MGFIFNRKLEAIEKFKEFKAMDGNERHYKIKCLMYDNGGEFTWKEFEYFCKKHSINRNFTIA